MKRVVVLLLAGVTLGACRTAAAQVPTSQPKSRGGQSAPLPAGIRQGANIEGITEYTLANGMRVLLVPDPAASTVTFTVTYLVGSLREEYGETGMAHLLEHLLLRGDLRGANGSGSTWFDRTYYSQFVTATDANVEKALDLEARRMANHFISKRDLDSEFPVVRNELEIGENAPARILAQRAWNAAFLWHNYGKSTVGAQSDIENVPVEHVRAFYRKYYQPDNAILAVAGRIDTPQILKVIARTFGAIPRPIRSWERGNTLVPTYTTEPPQDGEREVTLRRVGGQRVALVMYHVPAAAHGDFPAISVLAEILGATSSGVLCERYAASPSGRLHTELVDRKIASSIWTDACPRREPGVLMAMATARQEQSLELVKNALVAAVEGVVTNAPSDQDVERAKTALLNNLALNARDPQWMLHYLSEWMAAGDWRLRFIHRDRLRTVTAQDVRRVASAYLRPSNRTLAMYRPVENPDRVNIPAVTMEQIAEMAAGYRSSATAAVGDVFNASPVNIEARSIRSSLPNGLKLTLLPKATRANGVLAQFVLRFGDEQSLRGRASAARLLGSMLDKGTRNKTRQQIRDELDRLSAQVAISGSVNTITTSITTTRSNVPATLRLVAEVLREPSFDPAEFEKLRAERLSALQQSRSDPFALGGNLMARRLWSYPTVHPLATHSIDEQIEDLRTLTAEDLKSVFSELVAGSSGDLSIVRDFAADSVTALASELFGSWRSPRPFARLPQEYREVAPFSETIETPDKANAVLLGGQLVRISDSTRDYAGLVLANYMLGANPKARVVVRNEKEGLSYRFGTGLQTLPLDGVATFTVAATYKPENVLRVQTAFTEEITRALRDGFSADELEEAKKGWLQQRAQRRSEDAGILAALANQTANQRDMSRIAQLEARVAELTLEEVNATMRKYIDPKRMSFVRAGDFANHPPKP